MVINRILLDLDGVCVDFFNSALSLHGRQDLSENWPEGLWDMEEALGLTIQEFLDPIHNMGADFWANLRTYSHSEELWKTCNEFAHTYICTAQTKCGTSAHGKVKFVQKWFSELGCPERADDIIITKRKQLLAMPGVVLVDDRDRNCEDFTSHGGHGILFPAHTNSLHKHKDDPVGYVRQRLIDISGG